MRRGAYYNEHDPFAAAWLRNLISAGHIAPGDVDERDIRDIQPDDLRGYVQCHFFAGIGVWSYALRNAGWADDRPIWTGSCPCQPFSAAGRGHGFADERHLWPYWHWLIAQLRPPVVAGEQVASKDGLGWLDLVSADLEGTNYAFGASDLCAAGFDGAHIRQRLYFAGVDNAAGARCIGPVDRTEGEARHEARLRVPGEGSGTIGMADANGDRHDARITGDRCAEESERGPHRNLDDRRGGAGGLVDVQQQRLEGHARDGSRGGEPRRVQPDTPGSTAEAGSVGGLGYTEQLSPRRNPGTGVSAQAGIAMRAERNDVGSPSSARWPDAPMLGRNPVDWLYCRDGKWRPVEPGTFPLVDQTPSRVGRLRAYGNALDAETATQFVGAVKAIDDFMAVV